VEQRVQTGQPEGSLFRDPPPRRQEKERTETEIVRTRAVPAQDAREGAVGHHVRYVLGFGLLAIIIAFIVVYAVYFA
jgi:hypothetical protein